MSERKTLCAFCGQSIHEEDDWWVDDDGNLVCEESDGSLGPHAPTKGESASSGGTENT